MDFKALKDNLIYTIKESQLKLGYTENAVSLNYPPASLCRLLGEQLDEGELREALAAFADYAADVLGKVKVSVYDGQYCLSVSAEGARYVHEQVLASPFLLELVDAVRARSVHTIDEVLDIFRRYSDSVTCEPVEGDGYDHVVYFADGQPDDFVYLFETDFGHVSYHRMTRADYAAEIE